MVSVVCIYMLFNGKAVKVISMGFPISVLEMIYEMIQMYAEYFILT